MQTAFAARRGEWTFAEARVRELRREMRCVHGRKCKAVSAQVAERREDNSISPNRRWLFILTGRESGRCNIAMGTLSPSSPSSAIEFPKFRAINTWRAPRNCGPRQTQFHVPAVDIRGSPQIACAL